MMALTMLSDGGDTNQSLNSRLMSKNTSLTLRSRDWISASVGMVAASLTKRAAWPASDMTYATGLVMWMTCLVSGSVRVVMRSLCLLWGAPILLSSPRTPLRVWMDWDATLNPSMAPG